MYYNKEKDQSKRYLTDMEVEAYQQELKNRCFCLGDISEKVFLDKTLDSRYRREKLELVFSQQVMITRRERERLDFFCTCVIVTQDEFKEYQKLKALLRKPIFGVDLADAPDHIGKGVYGED